MEAQTRVKAARNITLIGFIANLLLAVVKSVFGVLGHSQALLADGLHSFSDLLTDALVLFASHFGSQHADREHPYGHARIETAATVLLAALLLFVGVAIIYDGFQLMLQESKIVPHPYVILIAAVSVAANEWLFHATLQVAKRIRSALLTANAWHHRSDAASSVVVLIGVSGTLLGYTYLDAMAAIIVGAMICKMALSLAWSGLRELVDTAVDEKTQQHIQEILTAVPGVRAIHQLRTRLMGGDIFVDVHILVDSHLTVSEGHHISQLVHKALLDNVDKVIDVVAHIDPEDDEIAAPSLHLPPRNEIMPQLEALWQELPGGDAIQEVKLHYLDGNIHIDVYFPLNIAQSHADTRQMNASYQQAVADIPYVSIVKLYFVSESSR